MLQVPDPSVSQHCTCLVLTYNCLKIPAQEKQHAVQGSDEQAINSDRNNEILCTATKMRLKQKPQQKELSALPLK